MKLLCLLFVFVCVLLMLSCKKERYDSFSTYRWVGTFRIGEVSSYSGGCIGSVNPCKGDGEAKIVIVTQNDGKHYYFYYNGRLVRSFVKDDALPCTGCPESYEVIRDKQGREQLTWAFASFGLGYLINNFPISDSSANEGITNYFVFEE